MGFKLKREWFRSIESLLGLRKGVAEFLMMELRGAAGLCRIPLERLVIPDKITVVFSEIQPRRARLLPQASCETPRYLADVETDGFSRNAGRLMLAVKLMRPLPSRASFQTSGSGSCKTSARNGITDC